MSAHQSTAPPSERMRARGMASAEVYGSAVAAGKVNHETAVLLVARKMREAREVEAERTIGDDAIRSLARDYLNERIASAEERRDAFDGEPYPDRKEAPREGEAPSLAGFLGVPHWLRRDLRPPEPLLGEVVTNTTRLFLGGPTGLGKSHLGMAMAAGMATGRGFLHWRASRRSRVLYLDGEMARDLVQERLADLARRCGDADLSGLHVLSWEDCDGISDRFPHLGVFGPLNTPDGQRFLLRLLEEMGCVDAVFFDNRMSLLSGDMKEEQPWTDTMPLVKELTARRIAQIWIDHMGIATDRIYGTKTKEWQFDSVALLSKPEAPVSDVSFTMEFTKARRRKPSNRADFERVTLAMVDDEWRAEGAQTSATGRKPLTATERGWFEELAAMFAEPGAAVQRPVPGAAGLPGPSVFAMSQEQVRAGFVRRGRLTLAADGTLTGADRTKLSTMLSALKDKGLIGRDAGFVWLL